MSTPLSRRDAFRWAALATATAALSPVVRAEKPKKKIPIGLELFSVRNELKTDFTGTIEAVGKMGYAGVEFAGYYGWDQKPQELRKLLDANGLKCCGTHTHLPTLQGDELPKTIELHKILGNKFLICPNVHITSGKAWLDLATKFNEISDRAAEDGMLVGYHSHAEDFKKYEGKTGWNIFFDNTKPAVVQQIDTGNALDGGADPFDLIMRYPGRTKTTHIKEHGGRADTPVGEGAIDWRPMFEAYESVGGVEWYIIEHETSPDPLKTVKKCLENMHKMGR